MLIATLRQLYVANDSKPQLLLEDQPLQRVAYGKALSALALNDGAVLLLGSAGMRRIETGIAESIDSLLLLAQEPLELLLGTEAAHIYRLRDDGQPARRLAGFEAVAGRESWYTPWGGPPAVRSLARSGDWLYADIHVGSIMYSADRGHRWAPVAPQLHEDVHQVSTVDAVPERVYANTADGVFLSEDRGQSWHARSAGLPARYGRAIAVHPQQPDCLLASVSQGPRREVEGWLCRSSDGGRSWHGVGGDFPAKVKGNIDTFRLAFSSDGRGWVALGNELYCSEDGGERWHVVWTAPRSIAMLAA